MITIDAIKGELSVALSDEELAARKADWSGPRDTIYATGALWKYAQLWVRRAGARSRIPAAARKSTSMRISEPFRRLGALALLALLPGCIGGLGGGGTGGAPAQAVVTSDMLVITGPRGFCVDESATRAENDTAFVLLGNCAAISESRRADQPDVPVVLTAAISEASDGGSISESLGDLDTYFRSEGGRALLSRSQDAESVNVIETLVEADQFLIHASDTSTGAMEGVAQDYWRAYFDMGSRIATLSVFALQGETVSREDSLGALRGFVQSVRLANLADGTPVAGVSPQTTEARPPRGGLFNVGLFRRVFD
jgi:hypothetical protein